MNLPLDMNHEPADFAEAKEMLARAKVQLKEARDALELTRLYLEQRGIRHHGTEGRTKILPAIDRALAHDDIHHGDKP